MENTLRMDYDVDVARVVIAHRFAYETDAEMDAYVRGRSVHGLVCCQSGQAKYTFADGRSIQLSAGEIALIPATSAYKVRKDSPEPFAHYTVNFLGSAESLPDWVSRSKMHVLRPKDFARYLARFEELAELWRRMRTGYRMQTKAKLLLLLFDYLSECMAQSVDPGAYNRTLPAKRMIEERYGEPLTLAEMAESCGMCEGSFRRAFVSVYNQSPVAYLLNLRIEKGKDLLLAGYSLEETAQRVGFSDVNYFIRYFHKVTGTTPGRFRQMY